MDAWRPSSPYSGRRIPPGAWVSFETCPNVLPPGAEYQFNRRLNFKHDNPWRIHGIFEYIWHEWLIFMGHVRIPVTCILWVRSHRVVWWKKLVNKQIWKNMWCIRSCRHKGQSWLHILRYSHLQGDLVHVPWLPVFAKIPLRRWFLFRHSPRDWTWCFCCFLTTGLDSAILFWVLPNVSKTRQQSHTKFLFIRCDCDVGTFLVIDRRKKTAPSFSWRKNRWN